MISWIRWKGKLMLERMVIFTILKKVIDRKASDKKIIRKLKSNVFDQGN